MKVSVCTLGCKVNKYESDVLLEKFVTKGYEIAAFGEKSDVVIIQTCCVTEESSRKSRQMIRRAKKNNPECILVVSGCLPQSSDFTLSAEADIVVGNADKSRIPELVEMFMESKQKIVEVPNINKIRLIEDMTLTHGERTRAYVKIEDGCNNFCSYCIIPYLRGRTRSKDSGKVFEEVRGLVKNGYKEIVLTGIHLDSYLDDNCGDLCSLLEKLNNIEDLYRIRLGSVEANYMTEENIYRLSRIDKLCPQFHLSLQSGCDETLKRMRRRYDTLKYYQSVNYIRKYFYDPALTTDIIVGFPGENESEFSSSYDFVEKVGFSKIHVFPFSPRKGTVAYDMPDMIGPGIKKERVEKMLELAKQSEKNFFIKHMGGQFEVLFEHIKNGLYTGFTNNYIEVRTENNENLKNQIRKVKLTSVHNDYCSAEVIS